MKNSILFALLCLLILRVDAKEPIIKGQVLTEEGEGVAYATVLLQRAIDTSLAKAAASDLNGEYSFAEIAAGKYFIEISYVGFANQKSEVFDYDGQSAYEVPLIRMASQSEDLAEVVVKSTRPIVEVHPNKTVFNVDGSINAVGNTALELLRKSPGVVVDNNDNLMLQGKNGVQVYIDGKKSPLNGDDLANYLKSTQSSEIDAIEIITNPSAKYDAEGNAGIINIRLKKDQSLGLNGTLNLGYRYGETSKYNGGVTFNYRDRNFNTFGSYNFSDFQNNNMFFLYREQGGNIYDQLNQNFYRGINHGFRLGTDLFIDDKNTIGVLVHGNLNDMENVTASNTDIFSQNSPTRIDSFLQASNDMNGTRENLNFNVNYAYNGEGKTLNFDADYGYYRNDGTSYQPNRYLAADESLLSERIFSNVTPTNIDIYTAKIDYESNLFGGKLGLGAKSSIVRTDNTFNNFDIIEGKRIKNLDRSNNFVYRENVNAAYTSWQKAFGEKWNFMAGLRIENTESMGDLTSEKGTEDEVVERSYTDYFPSAGLTFQAHQNHSLRLNYSRRIDRPGYQDLNPFEFRLDELTYQKGNPFLNPQYSNSYSLSHTYKHTLNTSLSYTVIDDIYSQITDIVDDRATILTWENLARQTNTAITISYPFSVTKWWNVYATVTGYHLHNEANIDGKIIDLDVDALNFYGQNTFMLPKDFKLEISGWYNSPTLWGNWVTNDQYDVSAGVSKKFWNDNATVKLSVSDIFYQNGWGGESRFGSLYMRGGGSWESRQVKLDVTYLFGNKQVKQARKRSTGLEEEQRRVKS